MTYVITRIAPREKNVFMNLDPIARRFVTATTLFHLARARVRAPGSDNESGTKASKIDDRRGVRSNIESTRSGRD